MRLLGSTSAPTPYNLVEGINWSTLRHMRRSPLHYLHALRNERPDSDTFRRGRLVHTLVLEPERLERDYAVWCGGRRAGKAWAAFAKAGDRTIVTPAQIAAARRMADAVLKRWTPDERRESVITWVDPSTGLRCKARLDSYAPGRITEVKTVRDIALTTMSRTMHAFDYHCQLAHYRMGLRALTGVVAACQIVAVEADEPHDAGVFEVDEEALLAGEIEVSGLLSRVAECRASGVWPGRYRETQVLALPGWVSDSDANDLTDLGLTGADVEEEETTE